MALRHRTFLAASVAVTTLAGCLGDDGPETNPTGSGETPTETGGEPTTTTSDGTGTNSLDLREANVTGVGIERGDGRTFDVSVTLYHDDDGEEEYANWWQVETLDGERLGRRDLTHPHGTREFTRSAGVGIPEGVSCVVVRGHDETHAYGGQAMLVGVDSGETKTMRQGSDPVGFSAADCPGT
jgi:hypothetical protein